MIGYRYFRYGILWRIHHGAIIPLTMPHVSVNLSTQAARAMLRRKKCVLIRWESQFDTVNEGPWWHVIKDQPEEFSVLKKKVRNQIRRARRQFAVSKCEASMIANRGYPAYVSAFKRYDTFEECLSECEFRAAVLAMPKGTEFFAAFTLSDDSLVAFAENFVENNACFYSSMWFEPSALKDSVGYLLVHEMNKHYLNERGMAYVSDGSRSISHETGIHDFLMSKFGFRKAYSKLHVVYAPLVAAFVVTFYPLRSGIRRFSWPFFRKISVLLRQEEIRRRGSSARSV